MGISKKSNFYDYIEFSAYVLVGTKSEFSYTTELFVFYKFFHFFPKNHDKNDISRAITTEALPSAIKWGKFLQEADNPNKQNNKLH